VLPRIFEPFFTTKEGGKGTGLGLATVYRIVQQCAGHIHVYSEPNAGTVFRIYFPLTDVLAATPARGVSQEALPRGRETLLVVEDEPLLREMVRNILSSLGYRVLVAKSPEEAPSICAQHEGPIHLLLTDMVMPGLSGPEVADLVVGLRPEIRTLFMSGYSTDTAFRPGVRARDRSVLEKPFRPEELAIRIREELDQPGLARGAEASAGTVLIVDDDASMRESVAELLEMEGFHSVLAGDGREALNYLQANPAPDLILLDLRMPGMNGWVFRTEQQKSPALAAIPTVVLSGADDPAPVAAFLGTAEHLSKPLDIERFLALVRRYCSGQ
jgi:CheY-like chemotaxis protein